MKRKKEKVLSLVGKSTADELPPPLPETHTFVRPTPIFTLLSEQDKRRKPMLWVLI